MNLLIKHNLISGWRNILKYKTQNLISILCLSVGTVLFAGTLLRLKYGWDKEYAPEWHERAIPVSLHTGSLEAGNYAYDTRTANVRKLLNLRTVEAIDRFSKQNRRHLIIKNAKGEHHVLTTDFFVISSAWAKRNHLCSARTGKTYENLKNGTVLISESAYRKFSNGKFNLLGCEVTDLLPVCRIADVVTTDNLSDLAEGIYLVDDGSAGIGLSTRSQPIESCFFDDEIPSDSVMAVYNRREVRYDVDFFSSDLRVVLKDGVSKEQFEKDARQNLKGLQVDMENPRQMNLVLLFVMAFLGCSVLLIGISGYLKMQVQLFSLRGREMSLRRCHGAKPIHLFMLLASELLIVFILVFFLIYGGGVVLELIMEKDMQELGIPSEVETFGNVVFLVVILITFLASLVFVWLSVRKSVRMPLGKIVGKSYSRKTLRHTALQVMQYTVATIFFYSVIAVVLILKTHHRDYHYAHDLDYYQKMVCMNDFDCEQLSSLPSARAVVRFGTTNLSTVQVKENYRTAPNDSNFYEEACMTDPAMFRVMGVDVRKNAPKADIFDGSEYGRFIERDDVYYPVYALPDEVFEVRGMFGVSNTMDGMPTKSVGDKKYVRIGYAHRMDFLSPQEKNDCYGFSYYVVTPHLDFLRSRTLMTQTNFSVKNIWVLAVAKEGKYGQLKAEIDSLAHEQDPLLSSDYHIEPESAFDEWFEMLQVMRVAAMVCSVLAFVCMVSIVLSVYSSVSLETRGRRREVAIRKVNGAKTRNIVMMFMRYHIWTLCISFVITAVMGLLLLVVMNALNYIRGNSLEEFLLFFVLPYLASVVVITVVTFLTVWQKIYDVARMNPSAMMKSE